MNPQKKNNMEENIFVYINYNDVVYILKEFANTKIYHRVGKL